MVDNCSWVFRSAMALQWELVCCRALEGN
jgi:hypothetical protein